MKKYTIKNYKGNLVESLSRFAKSHKGMKIVEAVEEKNELKIKVDEAETSLADLATYRFSDLSSNDKKRFEDEIKKWIDKKDYSAEEIEKILKDDEVEQEELLKMGSYLNLTGEDDWSDTPEETQKFFNDTFIKCLKQKRNSARKSDGLEDFVKYMFKLTRKPGADIRDMAYELRKNKKYVISIK